MPEALDFMRGFDDKLAMKAVSAMLTECSLSIALAVRSFNGLSPRNPDEKRVKKGGLSALPALTALCFDAWHGTLSPRGIALGGATYPHTHSIRSNSALSFSPLGGLTFSRYSIRPAR